MVRNVGKFTLLNFQLVLFRRHYSSSKVKEYQDTLNMLKEPAFDKDPANKHACKASFKHYEDITNYLDSNSFLQKVKNKIPVHFIVKPFKSYHGLYIIDREVACKIFEKIQPYLESQKGHIIEVNAGLGVLTEHLLKSNFPRLRIYEEHPAMFEELKDQILQHKSEARLFKANLVNLPKIVLKDRYNNASNMSDLFQGIAQSAWEDDPVMSLIVAITNDNFLQHIIYSIIFQDGICSYGRPDLFVIMPHKVYLHFTSGPADEPSIYNYKGILSQILCESTLLLKVPNKAFVPWLQNTTKRQPKGKYSKEDEDSMFVVRMTPRKDLLQQIPPHKLIPLLYLVRSLMFKKRSSVITNMEKFVPGFGVKLISQGMTVFTKCKSLTPEEYLKLFTEFSSCPEFNDSAFLSQMNDYLTGQVKMGDAEKHAVRSTKPIRKREKKTNLKEEVRDIDLYDIDNASYTLENFEENEEKT